jgi:hypothetical protein
MRLTFVGKDPDSNPTGSPTVYRTDRGSWIVQGWMVTDPEALTQMEIPGGETAGEDIRWVPRQLVSSVAMPGNDFYLFDDRLAVFLLYAGNGLATGKLSSVDLADIRLCRSAFEAVWKLSIPHGEYKPV